MAQLLAHAGSRLRHSIHSQASVTTPSATIAVSFDHPANASPAAMRTTPPRAPANPAKTSAAASIARLSLLIMPPITAAFGNAAAMSAKTTRPASVGNSRQPASSTRQSAAADIAALARRRVRTEGAGAPERGASAR
jgi:hypothetical protein